MLDLITNGDEPITEEQMNAWNSNFVLLTSKDLKSLMQNKNSIIEARQTLTNAKAQTLRERDELRDQLNAQIASAAAINIEEITATQVAEKMNEANAAFEKRE